MALIFPSLIEVDIFHLPTIFSLLDPHVPGYHLDIMDNQFVPHLSYGPPVINAIARQTARLLWLHLMVEKPDSLIAELTIAQHSLITIHIEAVSNPKPLLEAIHKRGWLGGLALNPTTPVEEVLSYYPLCHHILFMAVPPGIAGQSFLPSTHERIAFFKQRIEKNHSPKCHIAVDGGVKEQIITPLADQGVSYFAIASAIFNYNDPLKNYETLLQRLS
jgi:ribulose-phosphate 3-epimerase